MGEQLENGLKEVEIKDVAELLSQTEEIKEEIQKLENKKQTPIVKRRLKDSKSYLEKLEELQELAQIIQDTNSKQKDDAKEQLENGLKGVEIKDVAELFNQIQETKEEVQKLENKKQTPIVKRRL